jgi:transcription elongation factor SPT6
MPIVNMFTPAQPPPTPAQPLQPPEQPQPLPEQPLHTPAQFLHILQAEKENLVTLSLTFPSEVKVDLERKLTDAFSSDNFTEAAKAWNAERSLVIQETLEQHLIPGGVKWIREVLRDEAEDFVSNACGKQLRKVSK